VVARADVIDLDDGDDLFELFADLVENPIVPNDNKRHPGEIRIFGFAHGERIDVVTARSQHARDVGEHAGHVLNHRG
jgi:hypothetical protein